MCISRVVEARADKHRVGRATCLLVGARQTFSDDLRLESTALFHDVMLIVLGKPSLPLLIDHKHESNGHRTINAPVRARPQSKTWTREGAAERSWVRGSALSSMRSSVFHSHSDGPERWPMR